LKYAITLAASRIARSSSPTLRKRLDVGRVNHVGLTGETLREREQRSLAIRSGWATWAECGMPCGVVSDAPLTAIEATDRERDQLPLRSRERRFAVHDGVVQGSVGSEERRVERQGFERFIDGPVSVGESPVQLGEIPFGVGFSNRPNEGHGRLSERDARLEWMCRR
jgi:hypothetical protein